MGILHIPSHPYLQDKLLACFPKIQDLVLSACYEPVISTGSLSGLTSLTRLSLFGAIAVTPGTTINELSHLTQLRSLELVDLTPPPDYSIWEAEGEPPMQRLDDAGLVLNVSGVGGAVA